MTSTKKRALLAIIAIVSVVLFMVSGMDDYGDRMCQLGPTTAVVASE